MKTLLVDNSNTRTKFAFVSPGNEWQTKVMPTQDISKVSVERAVAGWSFERVCICSVVPQKLPLLVEAFSNVKVEVLKFLPQCGGIDFSSYPGWSTLGMDRVANVLGAKSLVAAPFVAIDMGTATTLDVVHAGGNGPVFLGGMIAPGMQAMAHSLQGMTAMLPVADLAMQTPAIGRNTQEALASAVRYGYPGMIDSLIERIEAELGCNINVVLTGGDAPQVLPMMRRTCLLEPLLTMRGIAFYQDLLA